MFLHSSNRMEVLLDQLAEVVQQPLAGPFQKEIIVVQSHGMERWIAMELAQRLGIWANGWFLFPRAAIWDMFRRTLGEMSDSKAFEPENLVWAIMELLPIYIKRPDFSELNSYLQGEQQSLKRYQLAQRVAMTFDQYIVFRPDMIERWERGEDSHWQAILWRALIKHLPGHQHRATARQQFFHALKQQTLKTDQLPPRLCVFGISALPPFFVEVFIALSQFMEVHLFVMNPCEEYWGDIVADSEIAHRTLQATGQLDSAEILHLEKGNTLLASMGKLGRDYLDLLQDASLIQIQELEAFYPTNGTTLLACLQNDILQLQERGEDLPVTAIMPTDRSLQIHACHSPMREVEVLHDQLLALFDAEPELLPRDIVVMTPNVEEYAAYIQAVFATTQQTELSIPFSISDRGVQWESAIIGTFLNLLQLGDSRFNVSMLLSILEDPCVQRCFQISQQDMILIQQWVSDVKICWGLDENSRSELGLPSFRENSWWFGLDRLLLGYAMTGNHLHLFDNILSYDEMEGNASLALGKLVEFIQRLQDLLQGLQQAKTLAEWQQYLEYVLQQFFYPDVDAEQELQSVRESLHQLLVASELVSYAENIGIEVVVAYLQQALAISEAAQGFLQGHVTFCSMVPMRSIPFKIMCLIGLNDQVYPRSHKPLSFDLMADEPRKGDRSRRNDDRYLFLESLLSAREYLYISYVGQSIQDNSEFPPSVVVSELQDYLDKAFTYHGKPAGRAMVCHHPLQAFSQRYFMQDENPYLVSYAKSYVGASRTLSQARIDVSAFIQQPLSVLDEHWKQVSLDQWLRFFRNSVRFLLRERLQVNLEWQASLLDDREPMSLSSLDKFNFTQLLIEQALQGEKVQDAYDLCRAEGLLPMGVPGQLAFQQMSDTAIKFAAEVKKCQTGAALDEIRLDIMLADCRLTGTITSLWQEHMVLFRAGKLNADTLLTAWIQHLLLNVVAPEHYPRKTIVLGIDTDVPVQFKPVKQAKAHLLTLMALYQQGLIKPLPLFPRAGMKYMKVWQKRQDAELALQQAENEWLGSEWSFAEQDSYAQLCFPDGLPQAEFEQITRQVFEPLCEATSC